MTGSNGWHGEQVVLCLGEPSEFRGRISGSLVADGRFAVRTVEQVADALSYATDGTVDCVVVVREAPDTGSFPLLDALEAAAPDVPVVLCATDGSGQFASDALARGADDYVEDPDGSSITARVASVLENAEEPVRTDGDVSEQREGKREHARTETLLRTMVSNLPLGVIIEDSSRNILLTNERLCDLLDIPDPPEALEGNDCASAAEAVKDRFADPAGFLEGIERRLDRQEPAVKEELQLADGRALERDYIPYELPDGTANMWLYRDVTERRVHQQQLEREIDRLDEFASIVSHDLRNPLNVAEGHIELAQEECDSEHLDGVADALDRMATLIEDTLTLARQGQTVDHTEWVDLTGLLSECWQTVDTGDATLTVEDDIEIWGDPERLRSLFENLFRNAVEHADGTPIVRVGKLDSGGLYVADDGPGIPESERESVFDPGYSTADGGTGFGLAIVDTIADAHGWTVTITESRDGGARFEITGVDIEPDR